MTDWTSVGQSFSGIQNGGKKSKTNETSSPGGEVQYVTERLTFETGDGKSVKDTRQCRFGRRHHLSSATIPRNSSVPLLTLSSTRKSGNDFPSSVTPKTSVILESHDGDPLALQHDPNRLWVYDIHYSYHVPLLEKPCRDIRKDKKPIKKAATSQRISEARKFCNENPTLPSGWLTLSSLESESHLSGLTEKERLNRRLLLVKEGLEACHYDTCLLLEFLKILEKRDSFDFVQHCYVQLLQPNSSKIENGEEEEEEEEEELSAALHHVIKKKCSMDQKPYILYQFLQSLCHSSKYSCSFFFEQLFQLFPTLELNNCRPALRFDETAEMFQLEKENLLKRRENWGCQFFFLALYIFSSSSQWSLVDWFIQVFAHMDRLSVLNESVERPSQFSSALSELWEKKIPLLGLHDQLSFSIELILSKMPHLLDCLSTRDEKSGMFNDADYHDVLFRISSVIKEDYKEKLNQYKTAHDVNWFHLEMIQEKLISTLASHVVHEGYDATLLVEPPFTPPKEIQEKEKLYFVVEALVGCNMKNIRHSLFDVLGNPFFLVRHGSLGKSSWFALCDTQLDLIIVLQDGLKQRLLVNGQDVSFLEDKTSGSCLNQESLLFLEAFGFSLGGTSFSDVAYFNHVAEKNLCFIQPDAVERKKKNYPSAYEDSVRKYFNQYELSQASLCSFYITHMLSWCLDDSLLFCSLIGYLSYMDKKIIICLPASMWNTKELCVSCRHARKLLQAMDTSQECWAFLALYRFISCPTLQYYHQTRKICQRVVTAMKSFPNDYGFLSVFLRVEGLGLMEYQKMRLDVELTPGYGCAPCILRLLCCATEGSLDEWIRFSRDENYNHFNPWDQQHVPSRVQLLGALKSYETFVQNILNHDLVSSQHHSQIPYILLSSLFSALLSIFLLSASCQSHQDAWDSFRNYLTLLHIDKKRKDSPHEKEKILLVELEGLLDILLLCVMTCCSSLNASYTFWNFSVLQSILKFILDYFPNHHRAGWITAQVFRTQSHLVKFRCFLSPRTVSMKTLVVAELATGFPCFRRLEEAFESTLTDEDPKRDERIWDLYLHCLYLARTFGWELFTGLPKDDPKVLRDVLTLKLCTVSQRASFNCPYSKKLWLHRLYILQHLLGSNDIDSEKYLDEVELLCTKQVYCHLDPLLVISSGSCH